LSLIFNEQKLSNIFFKDFKKQHTHLSCKKEKKHTIYAHIYVYKQSATAFVDLYQHNCWTIRQIHDNHKSLWFVFFSFPFFLIKWKKKFVTSISMKFLKDRFWY
jgi:hypothetical protein